MTVANEWTAAGRQDGPRGARATPMTGRDHRAALASGMAAAIVDYYCAPPQGAAAGVMDSAAALASVKAMLAEALPFIRSEREMDEICRLVAVEMLARFEAVRDQVSRLSTSSETGPAADR
jgi:hypothetical protein